MPQHHDDHQGRVSRREALKTLAAITGATMLSQLPDWHTPIIEVGTLPAHAQISPVPTATPAPLIISNLARTQVGPINTCLDPAGRLGTAYRVNFTYSNPSGNPANSSAVLLFTYRFEFINSVSGNLYNNDPLVSDSRLIVTGNAEGGTVSIAFCTRFVGTAGIIDTITLTNPTGQSDTDSITTLAPPGAQGTGTPSQS